MPKPHEVSTVAEAWELVLLPGMDGTGILLEGLLAVLPPQVAVTVVRYPPRERRSFDELVSLAAAQLPQGKPLVLVGESFSGPVVVELIRRYRPRVWAVVFCVTFARTPRALVAKLIPLLPLDELLGVRPPRWAVKGICLGQKIGEESLERFYRAMDQVAPTVLVQRLHILAGIDVLRALEVVNVPCLYLQAAQDRMIPAHCLEPFRRALPQLQVTRIPGPHFLLEARPEAAWGAVNDFIARLPPPPGVPETSATQALEGQRKTL